MAERINADMDWTQYTLRRTLPGAEHGRRPPCEAVACRLPSFFTSFLHVFERDTPMDLVIGKWLFSNVFLCGQFQYTVLNRWNFNVLRFSLLLCGQFQYMLY